LSNSSFRWNESDSATTKRHIGETEKKLFPREFENWKGLDCHDAFLQECEFILEGFPETNLDSDCAAGSKIVPSQAVGGEGITSTVRKRISRSDRKLRFLEYFSDIFSLAGMMRVTYCSSTDPA